MEAPNEEYRPLFGAEVTDRPLFGVSNRKDRAINLFVGCVTAVIFAATSSNLQSLGPKVVWIIEFCGLQITLVSAFAAHNPPKGINIYFALCISLVCVGHVILIYWYRQGDLDPKFRLMIYYNAFTVILLSICALSFFFTDM